MIDVFLVHLDRIRDTLALLPLLDDAERRRASRFHFAADSRRFIVSHAALRLILAEYAEVAGPQLIFETNRHGKPALLQDDKLFFNLSHSGELALCCVTAVGEVGIDIECRRKIDGEALAQRFFSDDESAALARLPADRREQWFFSCWTRKEAYIKAKGLGLSLPLDQFSVQCAPDKAAALISSQYAPEDVPRFSMWDLPVPDGYQAALALCGAWGGVPAVREWDFGGR